MIGGRNLRWLAYLTLAILILVGFKRNFPEVSDSFLVAVDRLFPTQKLSFSGWPDWIQAASAIIALTSAPALLDAIIKDVRSSLKVTFSTKVFDNRGLSQKWLIVISAKKSIIAKTHIHVYPHIPGNEISSLEIISAMGGVAATAGIDNHCDGHIVIDRMPDRASIVILARVYKSDKLSVLPIGRRANSKTRYEQAFRSGIRTVSPVNLTAIAHNRLMLLLLISMSYFGALISKIIFIGLFHSS